MVLYKSIHGNLSTHLDPTNHLTMKAATIALLLTGSSISFGSALTVTVIGGDLEWDFPCGKHNALVEGKDVEAAIRIGATLKYQNLQYHGIGRKRPSNKIHH
jgi:hypothetical protein